MLLNTKPIIKILSSVMVIVGIAMLIPTAVSFAYKESNAGTSFLVCAIPMIVIGLILIKTIPTADNTVLRMRDGFFIVATAWIWMSILGALPFVISKSIPNFADAFFETASGFSTTGSTILSDIEALPMGMLFWRSFTHFLGGMGVLVLTVAILPMLGIGGQKIMRAETTGPTMDKVTYTIAGTAKRLYLIYTGFTVLEIILLCLGGMPLFDSAVNSFGTLGTGGLALHGASIGYYNSFYVEMVVAVFMFLAGINFSLYYYLFTGQPKLMFKNAEFKTYISIVGISTLFLMITLYLSNHYCDLLSSFRYSFFQVSSIITTTGYGTADFDIWPLPCRIVIMILMFIGGCAGSTGGGMKVVRILLLGKILKQKIKSKSHKNAVSNIYLDGQIVPKSVLSGVVSFAAMYMLALLFGTIIVSFEGVGVTTAFSSALACLSNIGPGFDLVGPSMNFAFYSGATKIFLGLLMIAGRLELYTIVLLFTPHFWSKKA